MATLVPIEDEAQDAQPARPTLVPIEPEKGALQSLRETIHSYSPGAIAQSIWQNPKGAAQTADDFVRATANAVTFGGADRLAGYMSGDSYEQGLKNELAKSEAARERSPIASTAGDLTGAAMLPGFGAEAIAARYGGGWGGRALGYGLTGAGTGAAQGAGTTYSGNVRDYVTNALIGGALGGPLGAVGGATFGARPPKTTAVTPTSTELKQVEDLAYNALRANPARYDAQHLAQSANDLEQRFWTRENYGREPYSAPASFRAIDQMRAPYAAAVRTAPDAISTVTPANIDFIRKGINSIGPSPERATDRSAGRLVKRALDDFLENPPAGAVMPGSEAAAQHAAAQAQLARSSHQGFKRAVASEALVQNARNRAGSYASGLGLEDALRNQYRSYIALDKKTGRSAAADAGFNPSEIAQMRDFATGVDTRGRNLLRWAAKAAGGGSGIGLGVAGAGGAYLIPGDTSYESRILGALALPATGLGLRMAGNRIAMNAVRNIDEQLRQRNPLYALRVASAPMVSPSGSAPVAKSTRDAIATEILKQSQRPDVSEWE